MDIGKHPYTFYLIALVLGIFLYPYISVSYLFIFFPTVLLFLFSIFIVNKIRFRTLFSISLLICWVLLGIFLVNLNAGIPNNHYSRFEEKGVVQYISVIPEEQNNSNKKNRKYTAEVVSISYKGRLIATSGKILLLVDKIKFDSVFILGNEYKLQVKLQEPLEVLNTHQFDYKKYLERNYIIRMGVVENLISHKSHSSFIYKIKNYNQIVAQKIDKSVLSLDSKEFLKAFLLGDRTEMKKDNIKAYSKAGIMHLIAISGMHVAFIFGVVFSFFTFILGRKNKNMIIIGSLVFVWLFGCFVGLSSSVFRACVMITIYYIFELLRRSPNIYHSLSLSAVIILLCNPYEIYSIGFQLSYIAVFFMSWLGPVLLKLMKVKSRNINRWVIEPLSITIAAQLGTMPFVLYYFHQFSFLSILANICIIPYTIVITYSSLIELGIVFLPENFQIYFSIFYDFLVKLLVEGTYIVSSIDLFFFSFISLNFAELILLTTAIILMKYFFSNPKLKTVFPFLVCLLFFQFSRIITDYNFSKKESLIVFNNKYPLVGFREGNSLILLKDKNDDLEKINSYIIEPYITGEQIKNIEYRDIDYQKNYKWKSSSIQILSKKERYPVLNLVDYLIIPANIKVNLESKQINTIVFTGNIYYNLRESFKLSDSEVWITGEQGLFSINF